MVVSKTQVIRLTVVIDDLLWQGTLAGEPIEPIVANQNLTDVLVTPGGLGEPATVEMSPQVSPLAIMSDVQTVDAGAVFDVTNPADGSGGATTIGGTVAADSEPVLRVSRLGDPATSFTRRSSEVSAVSRSPSAAIRSQ